MVGTYANGPSFKFYYQRGFGYLGATNKKAWCLMLRKSKSTVVLV